MTKTRSSRLKPLVLWFTPITRSPAQKPACKDHSRNGQSPAITSEATYTPVSNRAGSRLPQKKAGAWPAKNMIGFYERLTGAVFFPDR
ncbi:hypothetical protein HMPREF2621_12330 [Lactobacillus sp. HMSC072E07]|nr:hypothetical protein HMPREF2621_12330 [Lactobacillus sp. HMSC072E07]